MNDGGSMKKIRALEKYIEALEDVWDGDDPDGAVEKAADELLALVSRGNDVENR